jgi:hypothetical protein
MTETDFNAYLSLGIILIVIVGVMSHIWRD